MSYYVPLPAARIDPQNALLNLGGVNAGINAVRDQNNENRNALMRQSQLDMQKEQQQYQRGRDQKQDARHEVQWFGEQATAVDRMQGPQRAQAWQAILARHGTDGLSPQELDPMTGPKLLMAAAGKWRDPREDQMKDLDIELKRATIARTNAAVANGGSDYGKAGTIVQDPRTGGFYSVQYGARGEPKVTPLQIGGSALTPARGVETVGDTLRDKATGRVVENIGPNLAGAERQKVIGREGGERQMQAPKAIAALQAADAKTDLVLSTLADARSKVSPWSTGMGGALLVNLPASQAKDLRETIKTLVANSGFEELQSMRDNSPTGGALGQVAVQELEMLQKVRTSLEQSQTMGQLLKNMDTFGSFVKGSKERRRKAFEMTYGSGGNDMPTPQQPAVGLRSGNYRYNPQTGELEPQ